MEGIALTVTTGTTTSTSYSSSSSLFFSTFRNPICSFPFTTRRGRRGVRIKGNNGLCGSRFLIFASSEEPKLDPYDQMELKFGRLLGEDPKLTIAKIMARKANPDVDYLDVEKSFYKNKGKMPEIKEVPLDWSKGTQSPSSSSDGLGLVRPVPKNGFEYKSNDVKPVVPKIKRPTQPASKAVESVKRIVPNVILRKPTLINEPDLEDKPSRLRLRPNLSLAMRNNQPAKEEFSDMTLLRKPEPVSVDENNNTEEEANYEVSDFTLLNKPKLMAVETELESPQDDLSSLDNAETIAVDAIGNNGQEDSSELTENSIAVPNSDEESEDSLLTQKPTRLQPDEQSVVIPYEDTTEKEIPRTSEVVSNANFSVEAALLGKPRRLDQSVKQMSVKKPVESENLQAKGVEDIDWARAENLLKTGYRGNAELISCSARGFTVSLGSLVGFLPYRNLSSKWKFLAFESWLRRKGVDPALYRQNLGIIGNFKDADNSTPLDSSEVSNIDIKVGPEVSPGMKVEDLLKIYDQEKTKFLSSFVGQKVKVNVVQADRKSGKLMFSVKPKEKDELIEKKRSLMAKLKVGDIVKCCIKKITYFGIFVEIDEVPALIHQSEVSWDATLDPSAYFKVGQIVEAKVHQLDFALDRIFLSLKEIMPDPLIEALESVISDRDPLDGGLQAAETDTEWTDVESLIKELQQIEGIKSVSKGQFFLSPGLAPTFQVYMASMFENQYKLLARSENKVQEVIVETSLDKEDLKSAIQSCTDRVE